MEPNFEAKFGTCPNCGSKERFLEQLGEEAKAKGFARPEWRMMYENRSGAAIDQAKANSIPIGSSVPGFDIEVDICMNCGTMYAIKLKRLTIAVKAPSPQPIVPNRAIRRHGLERPPFANG